MSADIETGKTVELPPEPTVGQGFLKPIPETTPVERLAGGAAGVAVITALLAMVFEGGVIVVLAGVLSMLMGPYGYLQQVWLTDIKALQETEAKLKELVDGLTAEQDRLQRSNDEFEGELGRLKDIGDTLETITSMQGQSVSALEESVELARENLANQQGKLKGKIINNVMDVVWGSDTNMDYIINEDEYEELIRRFGKMPGVEVNGDKLRDMIVGKEMRAIDAVLSNLLSGEDMPEEDRVFKITEP